MAWETILDVAATNRAYAQQWEITRKEVCPECENRVVRNTSGNRGCTFCGWTEDYGLVQQ